MNEQSSPFLPAEEPAKQDSTVSAAGEGIYSHAEEAHPILAGCSYLGVLFLIPLLFDQGDEFVRFHVRQGIALFGLEVVASFGFLNETIGSALMLVIIVISLAAAIRTFNGKKWLLPVIGHYAQRIRL